MDSEAIAAPSALELIAKIQATPIIKCADTGDFVACRVDTYPQCGQYEWRSSVYYWYVRHDARNVSDLVRLELADLVKGFFVNSIILPNE